MFRILSLFAVITTSVFIVTNAAHDDYMKEIKIDYVQLTKEAQQEIDCLAENIYYEAAHEPYDGRVAVALVTLNRVNDPRYPNNICGVVKQKARIVKIGDSRVTCQFSWYCEKNKRIGDFNKYRQAEEIALYVYANYEQIKDFTNGALFYHADYVNPRWKKLVKTTTIGRHIFYKETRQERI